MIGMLRCLLVGGCLAGFLLFGCTVELPPTVMAPAGTDLSVPPEVVVAGEQTPDSLLPEGTGIYINKRLKTLYLYKNGEIEQAFPVSLGFNPVDDKQQEGDGCTPEGRFYIFTKNPYSRFHLSLGLSYPNKEDAWRGLLDGLIGKKEFLRIVRALERGQSPPQNTALGGQIYIHGGGIGPDWTDGCVALENGDIENLYARVTVGMAVVIGDADHDSLP